jgi:hypothetical protein
VWFLIAVALAGELPGVCEPGTFLASDGRCTGSYSPWRAGGMTEWSPLRGGQLLSFVSTFGPNLASGGQRGVAVLDPTTGAVWSVQPPFAGSAGRSLDPDDASWVLEHPLTADGDGRLRRLDLIHGAWEDMASHPAPSRFWTAVRLDEGGILVLGGVRGEAYRADVWRYDDRADAWFEEARLPEPRAGAVAVAIDGGVRVCGGQAEAGPVRGCVQWDGASWASAADPPTGRRRDGWSPSHTLPDGRTLVEQFHRAPQIGDVDLELGLFPVAARVPGGGLVVVGDRGVWVDADGGLSALPAVPGDPHGPGIAVLGETVVVVGGASDGPLDTGWACTRDGTKWTAIPRMLEAVETPALETLPVVAHAGRVWVFGGDETSAAWSWAPGERRWRDHRPAPVHGSVAVPVGDRIWVLGRPGEGAAWIDPAGAWTAAPGPPVSLVTPAVVELGDGDLLVAGGTVSDDASAAVWRVDRTTGAWSKEPPLPDEHTQPSAVRLPDGRVLLAGGDRARAAIRGPDGVWVSAAPMLRHRRLPVLGVLADGRVVIAGGGGSGGAKVELEFYDPSGALWDLPTLP